MKTLKKLYNLVILPQKLFNFFWNWIYLNLTNTEYASFPIINGILVRRGLGKLFLGKNIIINSDGHTNPVGLNNKCMFYIETTALMIVGENVGISTSLFYCKVKITIEDNVFIGGGCQFLDNDFHSIGYEDRVLNGDNNIKSKPITIKQGAFIGASSIILKGVTIGKRSIVGAGSVVSKDIPDFEIWAGNPAHFIKEIKL